jgi:hypothetical protein
MRQEWAILTERKEVRVVNSLEEWARAFESSNRIVAQEIVNDFLVSTVFLGLNHSFSPYAPPLWFETMIFDQKLSTGSERGIWRYSTYPEALEGHAKALEMVKSGLVERKTSEPS